MFKGVVFSMILILLGGGLFLSFKGEKSGASVQGVSISTLRDPSLPYYNIYSSADKNSEIIYFAQEGEKLVVLDEKEGWYQVLLESSKTGWLSSDDVRSREVKD